MKDSDYRVVFVTTPNRAEAERIARDLVEKRLAACVNVLPKCLSVYRWQGEIVQDEEALMVIKTRSALFAELRDRILELHSYEVPEVVAMPIVEGSEGYLRFLDENVGPEPSS
jgi:periplasmic divalent cation tolerance protein